VLDTIYNELNLPIHYLPHFESLSSKMAPALASFEMSYIGYWETCMGELIFKGAGGTSCLSAITLHKIAVVMVAPSLTSWACLLDEVILDDTTYDWFVSELISKLENTPVLKSLVIYHDLHALTDKNDRPIAIPSLLLLKIHCMLSSQRQHISHLFFLIRASNLESLILDFPHHNRMSMFIDLLHEQPLSAKFPQLHILSLHLH
jgi:hypothetical protein